MREKKNLSAPKYEQNKIEKPNLKIFINKIVYINNSDTCNKENF